MHWRDWCWSWKSNTLATWCEELTHWRRLWCWERLKVGGEGDNRGWDGWMASLTQWAWVWVRSRSWWWTEAWRAAVHGVTKSRTRLSDWTESVMLSNHLIVCCPILLLPSVFPRIGVFSNESTLSIRWPKYRSFSFTIRPSNEYSGLISFRVDWFDILAVQGTLKSLQHYNSKASVLQCSALWSNSNICTWLLGKP